MDWWWYSCRVEHLQKGRPPFIHTLEVSCFGWHWNRCGLAQTNGMKTPRSSTGNLSKKRCTSWRWNKRDRISTKIKRERIYLHLSPFPYRPPSQALGFHQQQSRRRNPGYKTQNRRGDGLVGLSWGSWIWAAAFDTPFFHLSSMKRSWYVLSIYAIWLPRESFPFISFYFHG